MSCLSLKRLPVFFALVCLVWSGTACVPTRPDPRLNLISESDYQDIVAKNTQSTKSYDGFMNILDISATLLTPAVLGGQADHNARVFQQTPEQYQSEKTKMLADTGKQTEIFLSFFVPERKHDDLNKNNSKWKIFLDVDGRRYDGKATRIKALLAELQSSYPHHTRWHTPYKLSFPVPAAQVEKSGAKLILTGPLGSATLDFPPAQ
jgi:hypothetical protein